MIITLTIPDANAADLEQALCAAGGLPNTPANAKAAIINWIGATYTNVKTQQQVPVTPPAVVPPVIT